jgi:hypothetical protein
MWGWGQASGKFGPIPMFPAYSHVDSSHYLRQGKASWTRTGQQRHPLLTLTPNNTSAVISDSSSETTLCQNRTRDWKSWVIVVKLPDLHSCRGPGRHRLLDREPQFPLGPGPRLRKRPHRST